MIDNIARNSNLQSAQAEYKFIATSGIDDWQMLEDLEKQLSSNLSRGATLIEVDRARLLSNKYIHNKVLQKTKEIITKNNNSTTAYFFHGGIQGIIPLAKSPGSLLVDTEVGGDVEYLLQIVRSDQASQLREINARFCFDNRLEIINFLIENSSLINTLLDAYHQIEQVFTCKKRLSLKLCLDPEASNWEKLLLSIDVGCAADVDQVYLLKEYLDENWWIDIYSSVPNLEINVSFDEF